jgi:hypothetical protein
MKVEINLTNVIKQAAEQVYGSDERMILHDWMMRNAGEDQIVTVNLPLPSGPTFIRITDNQLIQLAHIIGANYIPAKPERPYIDEDGDGLPHVAPACGPQLKLVITQTELERDAPPLEAMAAGVAATSCVVKLTGTDADRVWAELNKYMDGQDGN